LKLPEGVTFTASNKGVVYVGPGTVEVQSIKYPKLETPKGPQIVNVEVIPLEKDACPRSSTQADIS
jgi:hypothetical protein